MKSIEQIKNWSIKHIKKIKEVTKMIKWLTSDDVQEITGCGKNKALAIIKKINQEFIDLDYVVPNLYKIPESALYERLGIKKEESSS